MKNKFLQTFIFFSLLSAGVSAQPGHKLLPAEQEIAEFNLQMQQNSD